MHFLQIWILPEQQGLPPSYAQKAFPREERLGKLQRVVSRDGRDGSITMNQDASLFLASLEAGQAVTHALEAGRKAYVQVLSGRVLLDGQPLEAGDGARIQDQAQVKLEGPAEVLLFDLP